MSITANPENTPSPNTSTGFHFSKFKHEHPPIIDVNHEVDNKYSTGQRIADAVASTVGSWRFIIIQSTILLIWLILNSLAWSFKWDPYPFILLNLALSFQAAYAAPFVMMSQNRQAEKDRLTAQNDYTTDVKGEQEICHMMDHLDHQDTLTLQIVQDLKGQNERLILQEKLTHEIVQHLTEQAELMKGQHQEMMAHLRRLDPGLEHE
jgi:uncharacterized membrane protein